MRKDFRACRRGGLSYRPAVPGAIRPFPPAYRAVRWLARKPAFAPDHQAPRTNRPAATNAVAALAPEPARASVVAAVAFSAFVPDRREQSKARAPSARRTS